MRLMLYFVLMISGLNVKAQESIIGTVKDDTIISKILAKNKIGLDPLRKLKVYLPPSYSRAEKHFPVVYYLHSIFDSPDVLISQRNITKTIDRNIQNGQSEEFVLVIADFTSPTIGSLYENSSTSGYWLDFIIKELIPYVDKNYRTIKTEDSRAITGDFMGGRGALKVAMTYPAVFGIVYALHPVATGSGYLPRASLNVDWEKIQAAKSYKDLVGTGRTQIFASICQAFLPNGNRPPLFSDFLFEKNQQGELILNPEYVRKEQKSFHLDEQLDEYADNLRTLKAIAFDWARFDPTQDHVISNRRFSKKLMDLGIEHEAEEFVGDPWNKYWGEEGRFSTRVLPFLNKHMLFTEK